jgi:adenine/guanine phosphoribosyltransferase-like PRPP-binding protein
MTKDNNHEQASYSLGLQVMKRKIAAHMLVKKLNERILNKLDIRKTLIFGVVLKGFPIAYSIAKMNHVTENFVPVVAHRPLQFQHYVNSYLPSLEWKSFLQERLNYCESLIVIDDVVNSGFTKQKLESMANSLIRGYEISRWFAALILNRKNLAGRSFVHPNDTFASHVNAKEVKCDWGTITVPLWDLPIEEARQRCEEYFQKHWLNESRFITITY